MTNGGTNVRFAQQERPGGFGVRRARGNNGPPPAYNDRARSMVSRATSAAAQHRHPDQRHPRGYNDSQRNENQGVSHAGTARTAKNGLDPKNSMTKHRCFVGMIFTGCLHEHGRELGEEATQADRECSTYTGRTGYVYSKVRPMVVVAKLEQHCMIVPMYSNNGEGLARKNPRARNEYVSVHDLRDDGPFQNQSEHVALEADMKHYTKYLHHMSSLHLAHLYKIPYGTPIEETGRLDARSAARLPGLCQKIMFEQQ